MYSIGAGGQFALRATLPVDSNDPRDAFVASVASAPGGTPELLLLVARYSGGVRAESRRVIRFELPEAK